MKKTIIFGDSEFAEVVHYYITVDGGWDVVAFTVNQKYKQEDSLLSLPIVPYDKVDELFPPDKYTMVIAIGDKNNNSLRQAVYNSAKSKGYDLPSFIHPTNIVALNSVIGESCLVFENNTIHPFVKIGDNVIIWSDNTVGHHTIVGDHCYISSKAVFGAHTTIADLCTVENGCNITPGRRIGKNCHLGESTLIDEDAENNSYYPGLKSKKEM